MAMCFFNYVQFVSSDGDNIKRRPKPTVNGADNRN